MEKRSLKSLTVGDKIKIIEEVKKGVKCKKDIASEFGIPASTLSTILKDKDKILKAVEEAPCLPRRKRFKASSFPEIEHAMTEWIKRVRDYNLPISGPLIQVKAAEFAKNLGLTFQASSGWLEKFKLRNRIVEKIISSESVAVSEVDSEHYRTNILPKYFSIVRHSGASSVFYLAQTYSKISKQLIRDNSNFLMILKQDDTNLRHIFNDHSSADMDFTEFRKISHLCWNHSDYGFLVIDKTREMNDGRYRCGFIRLLK
ncbi:tigger transposable element-derived protein 4-like [Acyrthosiphon pisum]|uniref:Tigger transposable element-derived protein 4 n=1 Tax=Acyrthosiphon pisum TaxID=7029 RepID=A0A8R2H8W8_ACYPI|nr:tigger transposable element-derived protein 4-like [Acyrthosiphon pisum]|eukprot:XP_016662746.1 PREDICTED: tigger transposable element-derived protein 4-like [Acyrthosiphon pisum]